MVKWLKSGLCKFGFMLSLLGAGTINSGCEFLQPEGQLIQCESDGVISEQEEQDIISLANKEHEVLTEVTDAEGQTQQIEKLESVGVTQFEGPIQMLINDTDKFFNQEFEKNGLYRAGISDHLHIYLPVDYNELREKYGRAYANLVEIPSYVDAFYSGANDTIYIPKGKTLNEFFPLIHHEIGHSLRVSDDEYPAVANELYSTLKLYLMNKKIGSNILHLLNQYLPREKLADFEGGYVKNYPLSELAFLIQANEDNGNLEKALYHILNAPKLSFEKKVRGVIENDYSDMRAAYLDLLDKLLDKPDFRKSFDALSERDFLELTDYIRASIYSFTVISDYGDKIKTLGNMSPEELKKFENPEILERAIEMSRKFLKTNDNLTFKAHATYDLTRLDSLKKISLIQKIEESWSMEDVKEFYDLSKEIVDINKDYPCQFDYVACPRFMTTINSSHVISYLDILRFYSMLIDGQVTGLDSLISLGEDFATKFYPTGKFGFYDNLNESNYPNAVAIFGSWTNEITASLYVRKMNQVTSQQNYTYNCEKAKQFFEYSILGSCEVIEDEEKSNNCKNMIWGDFYNDSLAQIEKLGDCKKKS